MPPSDRHPASRRRRPDPVRARSTLAGLLAGLALLLCIGPGALPARGAGGDSGSSWSRQAPWRRPPAPTAPGSYAAAVDLAAGSDGALWLLDGPGRALHRRQAEGTWSRLLPLPSGLDPRRLSVGEALWVLAAKGAAAQLLRLPASGGPSLQVDLGAPMSEVVDLAALPDGSVALARLAPPTLELRDAALGLTRRIDLSGLFLPDCAQARPVALAAAPDGSLWLGVGRNEQACPGNPAVPDPADPRPSLVEGAVRIHPDGDGRILQVEPGPVPLDLALKGGDAWRLDPAGPSGIAGEPGPPLPAGRAWSPRALAWLPDGRAALAGSGCPDGQALALGQGGDLERLGRLRRPLGPGPSLPLHLAAWGGRLHSLEAPDSGGAAGSSPDLGAPTLLSWEDDGRPAAAEPQCGPDGRAPEAVDLVAMAGQGWRLSPEGFLPTAPQQPALPLAPAPGAWWGAGAADGERLALLDLAGPRVLAIDAAGHRLADWPAAGLPADLALSGRYAYLSDPLARRVEVRDVLDGSLLHSFRSHLPLLRLEALGEGGGVLGLGAGGWALRYSIDGRLTAAWPLEQAPNGLHTGLVALPGGRGAVAAGLRLAPVGTDGDWSRALPMEAALDPYVESMPAGEAPALTAGEACVVHAAKRALPQQVRLGQSVEVELRLDGRCPATAQAGRLVIVLDPAAGAAARATLAALLPLLDDRRLALGLTTLQDGRPLELPPPSSAAALRTLGLGPDLGGAELAPALERAVDRLLAGGQGDAARLLLLLGPSPDQAGALALGKALDRARLAGILVTAVVHGHPTLDAGRRSAWGPLFAAGEAQWWLRPYQVPLLAPRLAPAQAEPAFQDLRVVDRLPAGLAPEPNSVQPPGATWDPAERQLTWNLDGLARDGQTLRYRLLPDRPGHQPAGGDGALAEYRDGFGYAGSLALPKPWVRVEAPSPLLLPYLSRGHCPQRRPPLDLLLALDLSSSMDQAGADGRSKLSAAIQASAGLVDLLDWQRDRMALVGFSAGSRLLSPFGSDPAALPGVLDGLASAEGTRIDLGLGEARRAWQAGDRPGARRVLILLTDGRQDGGQEQAALAEAGLLRDAGVALYAVGLGPDHDAQLLAAIAGAPERYLQSPRPEVLADRFASIVARESCTD